MRDRCGCGCGRWEAAADNAEAAAGSTTADVVVTVTRGAKSLPALRACVGGSCRAAGSSCTARGARAGPVYSNALRAALLWGAAPTARAPRLAWNKKGDATGDAERVKTASSPSGVNVIIVATSRGAVCV